MMGISRATVHRYCATGKFRCVRLNRKIFIRKKDIDALFDNTEPYKVMPINRAPITEFYTMQEITEKFEVSESTVYNMAIAKQIPKVLSQGKPFTAKSISTAILPASSPIHRSPNGTPWKRFGRNTT